MWDKHTPTYRRGIFLTTVAGLLLSSLVLSRAQESGEPELGVDHSDCSFFGPGREKFREVNSPSAVPRKRRVALLTADVAGRLPATRNSAMNSVVPGGSRTNSRQQLDQMGTIDRHLFAAMQNAGVAPADPANDYEMIRRLTLDLTGRIPTPERVLEYASDSAPDKRAKLVEELLASEQWIDKWTMFFGDLYRNTSRKQQINLYPEGRNAFHAWIYSSLKAGRPYDQVAREIIAAKGGDSYDPEQGAINWLVGGIVTGGPIQDIFDQQTANVAETFLGINHVNCILCHNGRGHLDSLSLWARSATRYQAWELASYVSRTNIVRVPTGANNNSRYYSLDDTSRRVDYPLNTTTGNRPARCAPGATVTNNRCSATLNIPPRYMFNGGTPQPGESYRDALAREVTSDFQFARATVNYLWKAFFGLGLVEPVNQMDPARLDPDNPPPAPWTLQPSNARLLNELAKEFVEGGYDLKRLMRQIATSQAYGLSARYHGEWNPSWDTLFARKLVRRLWGEEIHDAIAQSSNTLPVYNVRNFRTVTWAMQLPEPVGTPDGGGAITQFLDSFLRGNREEDERRSDGSLAQALSLMNDNFVITRIRSRGTGEGASLLAKALSGSNDQLIDTLYLTVLSRYPNGDEKNIALESLSTGNRTQKAENLLWSLYNKVDFIFNY